MKTAIALFFALTVSGAHAADILYKYEGKTVSLKASYDNYDEDVLVALYHMFSGSESEKMDQDEICVKTSDPQNFIQEISDLDDHVSDGVFEEHSLKAEKGGASHPVKLIMTDDPNEWEVGSLEVKFCD